VRLSVEQETFGTGSRRWIHLTETGEPDIHIFFETSIPLPEPTVLDGFVCATIFYAMCRGRCVFVDGPMSRTAIFNLGTFQEAWSCWRPDIYNRVEIVPTEIIDEPIDPKRSAIAAFSGGVDSIFSVLRHSKCLLRNASFPLTAAMLVHGFDVPLNRPDHFKLLKDRIKPLLDELKLALITVRTNVQHAVRQDWEDSHFAQLAGCLHNFSHQFQYGLVGSTYPYNALVLPWGLNPCTDRLLSGSQMMLVDDGTGYSRTEKVAHLNTNPLAIRTLKVCWQGSDTFTNCGICEKCVRTRLNFAAVGNTTPECFEAEVTIPQIRSLTWSNAGQFNDLALILDYAERKQIRAPWVTALRARLRRPQSNLVHCEFGELFSKVARRVEKGRKKLYGWGTRIRI
jgi:hypothetical protein